jgi:hypothetical protein
VSQRVDSAGVAPLARLVCVRTCTCCCAVPGSAAAVCPIASSRHATPATASSEATVLVRAPRCGGRPRAARPPTRPEGNDIKRT